jgi:RNA polymerase sigma-70 factor (ECF subfamily)
MSPAEIRRATLFVTRGLTIDHLNKAALPSAGLTEARALADLLQAVGTGSADAFTDLVRATGTWATAHAYALLRDRARAEDCVQQAYLEVWRTAHRYERSRGGAKGWLLSVVRHRAVDEIRATESDRRRLELFERHEVHLNEGRDMTSELAHARLDGYVVQEALDVLTPNERELIRLSYWSGLSHSQIAALTNLPVGTVKSRLRRGLQKLRVHVVRLDLYPE